MVHTLCIRRTHVAALAIIAAGIAPDVCRAQTARRTHSGQSAVHSTTLAVPGQDGQARVVQVGGRNYVDVESLSRLLGAGLRFQGTTIVMTPHAEASSAAPSSTSAREQQGLSREFVTASLTAVNAIRDWHAALATLIGRQLPVTSELLGPYRRHAEGDITLAQAAIHTDQDRAALSVLQTLSSDMNALNSNYISNHDTVTNIRTDALAGDALNTTVENCMSAVASMRPGGDAPGPCR